MEISPYGPDDSATVAAVVDMLDATNKVDSPFEHPPTVLTYAGRLRHGYDGEPPLTWVAVDRDRVVGELALHLGEWDNTHLAWADVRVHPDARRRGVGSRLLRVAVDRTRESGRRSLGMDAWEIPAAAGFARHHGWPARLTSVRRRQVLPETDWAKVGRLYDAARAAAASYELLRLPGHTPPDLLPAVADIAAAINDAPLGDLDLEDERFPPERILAHEDAMEARGLRLYRLVARHRDTGELVGHTVVVVEQERPEIGEQLDTSVVRAHRGHRLGLLLKADMMRWLADVEPLLRTVDTWNSESNGHMIAVNEQLGYRVIGRGVEYQRDV